MSSSDQKTLTLISSDNEEFIIEEAIAIQSVLIKTMIDDKCNWDRIPLPSVDAKTLSKVIEYFKQHIGKEDHDPVDEFDLEFATGLEDDQELLFDVILAANYMEINGLLKLCKKVASMIEGKSPEAIREMLNENDLTSEETEQIRKENTWAFQ